VGDTSGNESGRSHRLVVRAWSGVAPLTLLWAWMFGLAAFTAFATASVAGTSVGALFLAVGGVITCRAARSALIADDAGVTIRNAWTTKKWAWDELGQVGWDSPGWARYGGMVAISLCPLGDQHTYTASATAAGLDEHKRQAQALAPFLARHGVTNALDRETATVHEWWADPRSHAGPSKEHEV
jgi:hypothetical protein